MPGLDHPVGLVQHEEAQPFNLNSQLIVLLYDVPQSSGRRDKDVDASGNYAPLLLRGHASDDGGDAHERRTF